MLAKKQISGFSRPRRSRRYVYVRRRRDRLIDQSTGDALDRRRGPETELLRPGEPTPITLSVDKKTIHHSDAHSQNPFNSKPFLFNSPFSGVIPGQFWCAKTEPWGFYRPDDFPFNQQCQGNEWQDIKFTQKFCNFQQLQRRNFEKKQNLLQQLTRRPASADSEQQIHRPRLSHTALSAL